MEDKISQISIFAVREAYEKIRCSVFKTPLYKVHWLSLETGMNVYFKMESEQKSGSFKIRGALNYLLNEAETSGRTVVTATTGNHGIACGQVAAEHDIKLRVYGVEDMAPCKVELYKSLSNVDLVLKGREISEVDRNAREYATANNLPFINSYSEPELICGAATVALEVLEQLPEVDALICPVGAGNLLGGVSATMKQLGAKVTCIGCQPAYNCHTFQCVRQGEVTEEFDIRDPSLSYSHVLQPNGIPFELLRKYVDAWHVTTREETDRALFDVIFRENKIIEMLCACAVAVVRKLDSALHKNVVVVISGKNLGIDEIARLVDKFGSEKVKNA